MTHQNCIKKCPGKGKERWHNMHRSLRQIVPIVRGNIAYMGYMMYMGYMRYMGYIGYMGHTGCGGIRGVGVHGTYGAQGTRDTWYMSIWVWGISSLFCVN